MRLIDADELQRDMYRRCIDTDAEIEKGRAKWDSGLWIRYKVFEDCITLTPTADPVKHGRWDITGRCSNCGKYCGVRKPDYSYCPNCGAKMSSEVEE